MKVIGKYFVFEPLQEKPLSLLPPQAVKINAQQRTIMRLLLDEFGAGVRVSESRAAQFLRNVNVVSPFTKQTDGYLVFKYYLEQFKLYGAVKASSETFDEIRAKYAANVAVRVVDHEGVCQCNGVVTEAYEYGDLVVLAVWDADEPLAWAMVYLGDDKVQHYDKVYTIQIKEKK